MKKTLALVLALAMVFSTITVAFAEDTLGEDAQICEDLGMLKGETGTVDAAYVATAPTRLQAAVMFLRLKGLEAEALAFTGEENFADGNIAWAEGANLLAYLKANPQLGWIGDGTNFNPTGAMTAQAYYKVLLEALGYKQNTAEVVGDFAYADVIAFAAEKGLSKVAAVENYTVNDLAVATVEALKLNVKGGEATLAATLVEAGKIDKAAAIAADLYEDTATTTAKLSAVKAVANNKVAVTFDSAVAKAFAETADNYKIVVKGSTTALEVSAAVLEGEKSVSLTTAAQTAGTAYTLTVGDVSINFAGIAKETGAPEVDGNVVCIDTNTVEINFTKMMDKATAEDIANYTLNNGATVKSAALSSGRKTVTLTTEGVALNKVYSVKIANVKSSDLVAIKTVSKSFPGKVDSKAPTISKLTVVNNERIKVYFTDDHGVSKESAETLANWSIGDLEIISVEAIDENEDDYGYYEMVEIETASMATGTTYKLTINNLVDGSVAANAITKALTKDFKGMAADKTAPKVAKVTPNSDDKITVQFTETNRMDYATLTDINNYAINKDISVLEAKVLDATQKDKAFGKTVVLTTNSMDDTKTYELTVSNVADEFGNVITTTKRSFAGKAEDIIAPYVTKTNWVSLTKVELTFQEMLDEATAEDVANYSLSGDLGTVVKAELDSDDFLTVTLTTAKQAENKAYTITINNVKDLQGIATSNAKAYFTSLMDGADTTRPEVETWSVMNKEEVRVTFDEKVVLANGANFTVDDTDSDTNTDITFTWVGQLLDDETTAVFQGSGSMAEDELYTVTAFTGVKDAHNNTFVIDTDDDEFYGLATDNEAPEVSVIEQVDAKRIRVTFTEPIQEIVAGTVVGSTGTVDNFTATVDPDADDTTDAECLVELEITAGTIDYDKDYQFNFTDYFEDYMGADVADEDDTTTNDTYTVFRTYILDEDKPVIDYVEAVNSKKVKVVYNEEIETAGTFKITDENGVAKGGTLSYAIDTDDETIINITLTTALSGDTVYTLEPVVGSKDASGNTAVVKDVEFDFVGSSAVQPEYIKGVNAVDAKTIKVILTKGAIDVRAGAPDTISVYRADDATKTNIIDTTYNQDMSSPADADTLDTVDFVGGVAGHTTTTLTVVLNTSILEDVNYVVAVDDSANVLDDTYTFEGIATDGGVSVDTAEIVIFSGYNGTDYVVNVVYNGTSAQVVAAGNVFDATAALNGLGVSAATDDPYYVEVYRAINGVQSDDAVLYSKRFTR